MAPVPVLFTIFALWKLLGVDADLDSSSMIGPGQLQWKQAPRVTLEGGDGRPRGSGMATTPLPAPVGDACDDR